MPFKSESQRKFFHAMVAAGKFPQSMLDEWEAETPKGKKLPERVGGGVDRKKKARDEFLAGFLDACKAASVPPAEVPAVAAAALAKRAFVDDWLKTLGLGGLAVGALGTVGLPYAAGQVAGDLAGVTKNDIDAQSVGAHQQAAAAREYRRRAARLQTQGLVAPQDPALA